MSTPQSAIYICSGVRLDNRYEHSIYFATATAQREYFAGKVVKTFPAYSYLRKSWPLQVQATMEQAKTWSYLYFQNGTGKYYYYFITQVEYKNDNTVELTLELDVIQTYLFDFELLDCFVERQHTVTDIIGGNTVDEDLDLGELRTVSAENVSFTNMAILVMSTLVPYKSFSEENKENPVKVLGSYYDNVFNGVGIFGLNASKWRTLANILMGLDKNGFSDSIISIWMYPEDLIEYDNTDGAELVMKPVARINPIFDYYSRPTTLSGGYTPRNNKLLTYPYNILHITNNSGVSGDFRYELFGDSANCGFKVTGALSPDGNVRMYPLNYAGEQHAYEHGITLNGFPNCAWNNDTYKLWLAQNQNQQDFSMVTSALTVAGGAVATVASLYTGNGMGAVAGVGAMVGGAQQIGALLAQRKDMQTQPPQAKGHASASVNTVAGFQTFTVKKKTVDLYHAQIIDDYFTMYGYKINRVQKPLINARPAFTYVKTVGCKIAGNLCIEDLTKIESIFDRGVTFWRHGNFIGDYSIDNL